MNLEPIFEKLNECPVDPVDGLDKIIKERFEQYAVANFSPMDSRSLTAVQALLLYALVGEAHSQYINSNDRIALQTIVARISDTWRSKHRTTSAACHLSNYIYGR